MSPVPFTFIINTIININLNLNLINIIMFIINMITSCLSLSSWRFLECSETTSSNE